MMRYTIRLHLSDETSDVNRLRKVLSNVFSSTTCLTNVAHMNSNDGVCSIEIESEEKRRDLVRILKASEAKLGISSFEVEWGWDTAGSALAASESLQGDLFCAIEPQTVDVKEYRGGSWWLAIPLIFILIWFGVLIGSHLPAFVLCIMILAPAVGIGVSLYLHGPILIAASFRCDRKGLEIRPLLDPPIFLAWDDICGVKIWRGNRSWSSCRIQMRSSSPSITFLVEIVSEGPLLVKTIIVRASLRFVENSGLTVDALKPPPYPKVVWGHATYKRLDAK